MSLPDRVDERGVALPMALMALALLTSLMLALASLSQTEPVIGANHLRGSQARTLAESGLEYALWALANPTDPRGVPSPLPAASAPAPFDGLTFFALGAGGFTVKVAAPADGDANRRSLTAVGWVPTNAPGDARPKAHRNVTVDVAVVPPLALRAPCALCVRGALDVVGNVSIDGSNIDPGCGGDTKYGAFSRDATTLTGPVALAGGAGGSAQNQPASGFEAITLSPAALDALRTLAWRAGTYFGPGYPRGGTVSDGSTLWTGRIGFDASTPLVDGVVFVDTTDGRNVDGAATDPEALAVARLDGSALAARGGVFRGWLVVNGALEITGGVHVRGLLYVADTLTYRATSAARTEGLVVSLNLVNATPARLEAGDGADLTVAFDCAPAIGAGVVPRGFIPIPGTYREDVG